MRRMANEMANNNKYERRQEGKTKIENRESLAVWKVFLFSFRHCCCCCFWLLSLVYVLFVCVQKYITYNGNFMQQQKTEDFLVCQKLP